MKNGKRIAALLGVVALLIILCLPMFFALKGDFSQGAFMASLYTVLFVAVMGYVIWMVFRLVNKKKNETERKQEEQQEQEDEKEAEITISVDEATPVDLDSYVQIQPVSSKASSELDDNTAEKAIDGQEVTSWQEDVAGYGQGENLTLKFEKTYTVKYLALKLGSWKDDAAYEQNNRPKELDIQTDHLIRKVTFSDEKKEYWVTFSDTCKTSELKLIIEQVYRGLKTSWNDTCIAEVQVYGTEE